jgi:hypothetical protein
VFTSQGRVDHWWVLVFDLMAEINKERPKELELLVKLCCTLAHGNAFLERGMGLTKRVVDGRSTLSDTSVKAQKVVKQMILRYGGVVKVPITYKLMNYVRGASKRYDEEKRKETDKAAKKKNDAEAEAETARKKKLEEADMMTWQEKKDDLVKDIKASKEFIAAQEVIRKNAMEKALRLTNPAAMKTSMLTAKFAGDTAERKSKELNEKQAELASHMGKKPRK